MRRRLVLHDDLCLPFRTILPSRPDPAVASPMPEATTLLLFDPAVQWANIIRKRPAIRSTTKGSRGAVQFGEAPLSPRRPPVRTLRQCTP